jgi:hypothetical protein
MNTSLCWHVHARTLYNDSNTPRTQISEHADSEAADPQDPADVAGET